MVVEANADDMLAIGLHCIGFRNERANSHGETTKLKHFESAYGIAPNICSTIFHD
jgi:hypothetical protein